MAISVGLVGTLAVISNGTYSKLSSVEDNFLLGGLFGFLLVCLKIAPTIYRNVTTD